MAKGSKLKEALQREKGVDQKVEFRKKQQKEGEKKAEKRKRSKADEGDEDAILDKAIERAEKSVKAEKSAPPAKKSKKNKAQRQAKRAQANAKAEDAVALGGDAAIVAALEDDSDDDMEVEEEEVAGQDKEWETDDEEELAMTNIARMAEDSSDSEDDEEDIRADGGVEEDEDEDEDEEMGTDDEDDIALSDLESVASEDKEDIIPHQRLTINNTAALTKAYKSIALPSKLPFSENQVIVSEAPVEIEDIEDDLNRELAFYKQSLDAMHRARGLLKKEGVAFSRPSDYFAEMVKSDEHMGKIKQKLIDEAAGKRASADARRQRDLKKFGKQVQVAKLQERDRAKRDTMEKINVLKRKRQGAEIGNDKEDNLFDIALEDAGVTAKKDRKDRKDRKDKSGSGSGRGANHKREKRDEKYGFGGKKRFAKSNDATSAADVSKYSVKKMKGGKKGSASRPGKSRRAART